MIKILQNSKSNRAFYELVRAMGDNERLVYHSKFRWLFREKVMKRELVWFGGSMGEKTTELDPLIQDLFWLVRLAFLVNIFGVLNVLNITWQGCKIDMFEATFKITSFKQKRKNLEEEICNRIKTLKTLQTFTSPCKWKDINRIQSSIL